MGLAVTYCRDGSLGGVSVDVGAVSFQLVQQHGHVVVVDQLHQHLHAADTTGLFNHRTASCQTGSRRWVASKHKGLVSPKTFGSSLLIRHYDAKITLLFSISYRKVNVLCGVHAVQQEHHHH